MHKLVVGRLFGLGMMGLLLPVTSAAGDMAAPPPLAGRLAAADCVIVGKVVSLEEKPVAATAFPGAMEKVAFRVAIVNIGERLVGAKGLTAIRVGFFMPAEGNPRRRYYQVDLKPNQEACLILVKHHEESFYVARNYYDVMAAGKNGKLPEGNQVKKYVKLLDNPMAGLKSKQADDRFLTAALLIARYRTPRNFQGASKTEPISLEESKLILTALAEADWLKARNWEQPSPVALFFQLGLTSKDGWENPKPVKDFNRELSEAAKAWIKKHGDKYRIQRHVAAKKVIK